VKPHASVSSVDTAESQFLVDLGADYRSEDGSFEVTHRDGVPWFEAPLPPRKHECFAQTEGWSGWVNRVERCPCGAIRLDGRRGVWVEINARRDYEKAKGETRPEPRRRFWQRSAR